MLFVLDNNSVVLFSIDSGCEISILTKIVTNGINHYFQPQSRGIQGLGNEAIHPIGSVDVSKSLVKSIRNNQLVINHLKDS